MQLRRVVIGIDFSAPSIAGAEWTAAHFAHGAELVLVHVIDVPRTPRFLRGRFPPDAQLEESARGGADAKLRRVAESLSAGALVRVEVRVGRAVDQVAAVAAEVDADAIVIGKHGDRPGAWTHLGSTAEEIVRCSRLPVLVAAGGRDVRPHQLLVALDDSDVTPWVIRWTHLLATRLHCQVTAIHVVSSAVLTHVLSMGAVGGSDRPDPGEEEVRREFSQETDRWMRKLLAAGLHPERVDAEVAFGEAGQEIVAAAQRMRADLIVLGSRGAGAVSRALLGSVVREVLRHAPCPTLIISEPDKGHAAG
jgi:nucleotide-binding universal stress UspA family protein